MRLALLFVLAYAGTSHKEWKLVAMCSHADYFRCADWEARAIAKYPSALQVRAYIEVER